MKKSKAATEAISGNSKRSRLANLAFLLISLPFFLAGAALIYGAGVRPALKTLQARNWNLTPCIVVGGKAATGSDQVAFGPNTIYFYSIEGKQYQAARYSFPQGSSSGRSPMAVIVAQTPAGKNATCFVNPANPADAVFYRGFSWDLLQAFVGLPFLIVGLVGPAFLTLTYIRERKKRVEAKSNPSGSWPSFNALHSTSSVPFSQSSIPSQPSQPSQPTQPVLTLPVSTPETSAPTTPFGHIFLEPTATPALRLVRTVFVTVVWNVIVSIFIVRLILEWGRGNLELGTTLVLTPFVLIGIFLLFTVAATFLAVFNPVPQITIHARHLSIGESSDLDWEFSGSTRRVERLRIYLEGREETIHRQGRFTSIEKNVFDTIEIANRTNAGTGSAKLVIPITTMHSFKSTHNKIVWELCVQGDIPLWPDVYEPFEVEVLPQRSLRTIDL
jgi:hypothetical protein